MPYSDLIQIAAVLSAFPLGLLVTRSLGSLLIHSSYKRAFQLCLTDSRLSLVQDRNTRLWKAGFPPTLPSIYYAQPEMHMLASAGQIREFVMIYPLK